MTKTVEELGESVIYLLKQVDGPISIASVHCALVLADEEVGLGEFSVTPTKWGPRIDSLEDVLDELVEANYIEYTVTGVNDANAVCLGPRPRYYTDSTLSSDQQQCIRWVNSKHFKPGGSKLHSFLYLQFPEYFSAGS